MDFELTDDQQQLQGVVRDVAMVFLSSQRMRLGPALDVPEKRISGTQAVELR